jgi:hypothetical protein
MTKYAGYGAQEKVRPAFIVEPFVGEYLRNTIVKTEKGLVQKQVKAEGGYLVSFPKYGNSIHVTSDEELQRLGFDRAVPIVNDDGDTVDVIANPITAVTKKG